MDRGHRNIQLLFDVQLLFGRKSSETIHDGSRQASISRVATVSSSLATICILIVVAARHKFRT